MRYEDLPEDIKPLCWDGKEPITKLSDINVEELQVDSVSARAAVIKHSVNGCVGVLWGLDKDGNPIILDQ